MASAIIALIGLTAYFYIVINPTERLGVYQERWGAALSFACTGDMGVIDLGRLPAEQRAEAQAEIGAFLRTTNPSPRYDCARFPQEADIKPLSTMENHGRAFQRYQVGLHGLAGLIWMLTGPSWKAIGLLSSVFAACSTMAIYFVVRRFAGIMPAVLVAAFFAYHPSHTGQIQYTRDYAKVFFIFLIYLSLLHIMTRTFSTTRHFLAALFSLGLFVGLSISFRQDMTATALLCAIIIFLLGPSVRTTSSAGDQNRGFHLPTHLMSAAAFGAGFIVLAAPLYLAIPVAHSPEGHFLILGLSEQAFKNAGQSTGDFILNPRYLDYWGYAIIEAAAIARTGLETIVPFTETYNKLSIWIFIDYLITFPSLIFGRIYTIAIDIATSGSLISSSFGIGWLIKPALGAISSISIVYLYIYNRRLAAMVILFFFGMAAILSIQYMPRHYFHIHFLWLSTSIGVTFCALRGGLLQAGSVARIVRSSGETVFNSKPGNFPNQIAKWIVPVLLLGAALFYVFVQIAGLITIDLWTNRVLRQPVRDVPFIMREDGAISVQVLPEFDTGFPDFRGEDLQVETALGFRQATISGGYLEVRFLPKSDCQQNTVTITARYDYTVPHASLRHAAVIKLDDKRPISHFMAVYFSAEAKFDGLSVTKTQSACIQSMHWVENFPAIGIPVEFTVVR